MPAGQGRVEGMAAVEGAVVADSPTQDAVNSAAAEAAAASTAAPEPMMFSDLVKMANGLISMPFSSWVALVLLSVFLGWVAKKFIVNGHIVIALLLTATLLLLFDAALREDRSADTSIALAVAMVVVGVGVYKRVTDN